MINDEHGKLYSDASEEERAQLRWFRRIGQVEMKMQYTNRWMHADEHKFNGFCDDMVYRIKPQ